jgi:hypothetical protein
MMTEESWRAFVAMADAYERYGLKYFDSVEKMFPNLKPINVVWKNVMGIVLFYSGIEYTRSAISQ